MKNKKAQIWIETVIYTLIGLTIIGIILGILSPKITEIKDRGVIEQTISAMNTLDEAISYVQAVDGRIKTTTFMVKRGTIKIDSENDSIAYVLEDLKKPYSEVDQVVRNGKLNILTSKYGSKYKISIYISYDNLNLTFEEKNELKTLSQASTAYKIAIENTGSVSNDKLNIDFRII